MLGRIDAPEEMTHSISAIILVPLWQYTPSCIAGTFLLIIEGYGSTQPCFMELAPGC